MVSSFQDYWKDKGKKTPRENSEAVETTSPEITCKPDNTTSEQQHQSEWRHEFQRSRTTVTPLHKSQGRKQCTGCDYNRRFYRQVVRSLSSYLNTEWNQLMMHFQIIVVTSPWSADAKPHGTNRDFFLNNINIVKFHNQIYIYVVHSMNERAGFQTVHLAMSLSCLQSTFLNLKWVPTMFVWSHLTSSSEIKHLLIISLSRSQWLRSLASISNSSDQLLHKYKIFCIII